MVSAFSLQKAKQQVNKRPEKIITDGLWQYAVAIYKVMKWNYKEHKTKHVIDSGIGKNAVLERVNREVKRRVKWFSTFQAINGAEAFFKLFFYHYNKRTTLARNTG
jgi:transposase-like protein